MFGHINVVSALLSLGHEINSKGRGNNTALHALLFFAGEEGISEDIQLEMAALLLDNGIDVNAQNNDENSALHTASCSCLLKMCTLLINHGADKNTRYAGDFLPCELIGSWVYHDSDMYSHKSEQWKEKTRAALEELLRTEEI